MHINIDIPPIANQPKHSSRRFCSDGNIQLPVGVMLGYEILRHTDNLSKALQQEALDSIRGTGTGETRY